MLTIGKKLDVREHSDKQQYRHSLTKGYEYYRIRMHSERKEAGSTNTDAVFDIHQVFPNHRADLLNGEWEVFLETFTGDFKDVEKGSLTLQLPDIISSPNDFEIGANGCQRSSILAVVPSTWVAYHDATAGVDEYKVMPFSFTQIIARCSVGVKVDPTTLFQQGKLRVVITDETLGAIPQGNNVNQIGAAEFWQATILFVHRKSDGK
jgi:hypothetical protein